MDELSRDEMTKEQMIIVEEHEKQVSERQKAMGAPARALMDMMNGTLQVKPVSAG